LRIGRFVTLHRREMLSLNLPTSHVIIGQRWIKFGKNPATVNIYSLRICKVQYRLNCYTQV
jgi:hypothetical protein